MVLWAFGSLWGLWGPWDGVLTSCLSSKLNILYLFFLVFFSETREPNTERHQVGASGWFVRLKFFAMSQKR